MEQGFLLPDFTLPSNWKDHPQTKCYINLDTGDVFCYSDDMLCFVDAPPNQSPLNDGQTKMEIGDIPSATDTLSDSSDKTTLAMKAAIQKWKTKIKMDQSFATEDSSDSSMKTTAGMEITSTKGKTKMEIGENLSASEESSMETTLAMNTASNKVKAKMEMEDESSASEDSSDTYEAEPYAMETCPEKVEDRIVRKRRCGTCGGLGHNRRTCS
ncbi:uncharacterized protein [Cicer arietinum]|uniref:Uncharacterized protein LOC101493066 n=1 Tax=Cicer arietinum TaxID=3827 RepID=A0A1S2XPX6_CICAR|nr:uncharacterized protein LOC101493066 [Cicer arietinum]